MLQLLFSGLSSGCVYPTNLLPTGVVITSNNHHRRLLPTNSFGPPNRSIPVMRTEPSFLSNQPFGFKGAGFDFVFSWRAGPEANGRCRPLAARQDGGAAPFDLRVRVFILLFSHLLHHSFLSVFSGESTRINPFSPFS